MRWLLYVRFASLGLSVCGVDDTNLIQNIQYGAYLEEKYMQTRLMCVFINLRYYMLKFGPIKACVTLCDISQFNEGDHSLTHVCERTVKN